MDYIFAFLFLALAVVLGLLYHQFRIQGRMLEEARSELQRLDPDAPPARPPEMLLTVKVVDPIALAKRESKSARLLADRLPVMVKKMVYQQVMKEIREELAERDIEVEINIDYR